MNAVEVLIDSLTEKSSIPNWKIYCIGGATLTLINKFWPADAVAGTGKNAVELAKKIIADKQEVVHFFCGNKRREELPTLLRQQSIEVNEYIIYETVAKSMAIEKQYDAILFFSPSAVQSFFQKNKISDSTILFAIGETTETAIKTFCSNKVVLSDFPSKEEMVEHAIRAMS